ncbi:MAG: DNA translocase FtsK, partial [Lachnospiraceae bacterium]|nr:DNA translocase FtsK [Lachnospiraceae bacterium]
ERLKAEREAKETKDIHAIDPSKIKKSVTEDEIRPINSADRIDIEARDVVKEPALPEKIEPAEPTQPALTDASKAMLEKTGEDIGKNSIDPVLDTYKKEEKKSTKPYKFPPLELLKRGDRKNKNNSNDLLETANKLKDTLMTFGVEVTIDPANCSRGPSVTRYELTPAPGVKVAKIVSLQDDIKLSLGAADIRIEAPIPGKSAVGIEVPNSSSTAVPFGDLVASNEFKNADSKIAFTVGKDLSGDIVVSDIDKMPHLLIAGATGSGKSVCINTIIMSILYKAHPDDVKLIMIDPKVVELSVYNGIPHLLLPVVTDPKQASASLHWGVSEMEDRYKKFADFGVRDLKGYNEKIVSEGGNKLPQVVIIVDELADLMMVAGKEVEESICRLTQLARAAGIHLIIATQRPSVDVITGLIKANMPSRIAFAVSSGVDSRTILDTTGAEKLLGKGDMLFFPRGTNKPSRIQGCFVSDNEVLDVVDFIKNQNIKGYDERIIESVKSGNTGSSSFSGGNDIDDLFSEAGRFIIGKEKASIGALQRAFKIGFNRAARIMDQLEANGVVGGEEGTKPRKILMTLDEFEELVNKINN